jgi:hypothetical protein
MIHDTAVTAAILLTQEFDARGLQVGAQAGTPVGELVACNFLKLGEQSVSGAAKQYDPSVNLIVGASNNFGGSSRGEVVPHTEKLDALKMSIAKYVRQHISFAKNVVRPLIEELAEEIKKDVSSIQLDPYKDTKIVTYDLPVPLTDAGLREELQAYKNKPVTTVRYVQCGFGDKSPTELKELMTVSQFGLDKELTNWYATKGDAFLQLVWTSCFTGQPNGSDFQSLKLGADGLDVCLAVFLLCEKLHDTPDAGSQISRGNFNQNLFALKSEAAARLVFAIEEYESFVKTQLLIKTYNPTQITVIGEVYRSWVENGGNNAMVLASTLMPTPILHVPLIQENRPALERRWNAYTAMLQTTLANKKYSYCREIAINRTRRLVAENFKGCYATVKDCAEVDENLPEYTEFKKRIVDVCMNISDKAFDNLWELSTTLVCDCVFYYTDAGKILKGIDDACAKNPDLDVKEAALLSLIEYVTDYVRDQLTVKSL